MTRQLEGSADEDGRSDQRYLVHLLHGVPDAISNGLDGDVDVLWGDVPGSLFLSARQSFTNELPEGWHCPLLQESR
jgi:hypothetical protein